MKKAISFVVPIFLIMTCGVVAHSEAFKAHKNRYLYQYLSDIKTLTKIQQGLTDLIRQSRKIMESGPTPTSDMVVISDMMSWITLATQEIDYQITMALVLNDVKFKLSPMVFSIIRDKNKRAIETLSEDIDALEKYFVKLKYPSALFIMDKIINKIKTSKSIIQQDADILNELYKTN